MLQHRVGLGPVTEGDILHVDIPPELRQLQGIRASSTSGEMAISSRKR
jgi:hypothetical protein